MNSTSPQVNVTANLSLNYNTSGLILIDIELIFKTEIFKVTVNYGDNELNGGCDYDSFLDRFNKYKDTKDSINVVLSSSYTKRLGFNDFEILVNKKYLYFNFYKVRINKKHIDLDNFILLLRQIKEATCLMIKDKIPYCEITLDRKIVFDKPRKIFF